ncbi:protoporphyrinogen oxidase [Listeria grayi]|uniref:protoporphyrinogen oxidase n=1 Tax=Listeria grayi TaxID=1641 RepID=UPI001623ED04|nr:protoporphyrinogen oxidase [Listeria grayi]MBC1921179.1 protoporphyrinogen oxidase [Listeria grayi]
MKRVAIIGGGLSGLTAAYQLNKTNDLRVDLYEADSRLGGKFHTVHREGFTIEKGPDSFLARKPAGIGLIKELGLEDQLIANATGRSFIFHDKQLHPIPEGSVMGIPTDEAALLQSELLTAAEKERALQEKKRPFEPLTADISLGEFFEKRFGKGLVKKIVEPLLSGIYAGDIYKMSLRATFPQFETAISKAGNLMEGLKTPSDVKLNTTGTKHTVGAFRTLKGGLQTLIEALVAELPVEQLHTDKRVIQVIKKPGAYQLLFADGTVETADAVIIAATHDVLRAILDEETTAPFQDQPLTTLATVSFGYDEKAALPQGTGYLVARTANYASTACTWVQEKWPHMVPEGKMLLRGFVGKSGDTWLETATDEQIIQKVLTDYQEMMGLTAQPLFAEVSRMEHAMPQYTIGHLEKLAALEANLAANYPGIYYTGMSLTGVGIPDCIANAQTASHEVVRYLQGELL